MVRWTNLTNSEIERRRRESVKAREELDRKEFAERYQERCDRMYWTQGQCCAGCDHWSSDGGRSGECAGAGIVSGADVMRSIGATFSSHFAPPGFPFTRDDHYCGLFRDDFDWSTLDADYLTRIGAMKDGVLKSKPRRPQAFPRRPKKW